MPKVGILIGSASDFDVISSAVKILKEFNIEVELRALSAHRTPEKVVSFVKEAKAKGIEVIIAAAGKAAHLPGVVASHTSLPVIGVPVKSSTLDGLDALLSIVQMPKGVPVATVAIDGSENAALLALRILSLKYEEIEKKLENYLNKMQDDVLEQDKKLQDKLKEV
ncbi:MAG: 5-(carboxyamino)imidazole ribonucleotide mutase [Brevinematia bacterium]